MLKREGTRRGKKRHSRLPLLAQAGPVSLWMILFVTIPMLFIIYISFMTRGTFGGVEYVFSTDSYQTLLDVVYFKVIAKSFQVAVVTTVLCLLVGYPFAYYIARKPPEVASRLIMLIMIPFWTNSLMRLNAWMLLFQANGPVNHALMALGLTTGVMGSVFNMLGSMFGTAAMVIIFIVGHAVNFGINALGAYVHTIRLQYVELFSKFYEGGGRPFRPFALHSHYIRVKEETKS